MTGLQVETDTILEIAVIVTEGDTLEEVAATDSIIIHASEEEPAGMNEWCIEHHGGSGLTRACRESKISVAEAEELVLGLVAPLTLQGRSPLAGNTVSMDRRFLEKYMPRLAAHLHYRPVDVSTVKELARRWFPAHYEAAPRKQGGHRALDDIKESIEELKYYRRAVFKP